MNAIFKTTATSKDSKERVSFQPHLEDAICEYLEACKAQHYHEEESGEPATPKLTILSHHGWRNRREGPKSHILKLHFEHKLINATIESIATTDIHQ